MGFRVDLRGFCLFALLGAEGCESSGSWAQYEGHVISDIAPDTPASATLTVIQTGDTSFSGYLSVHTRVGGGGDVWGWYPADSVHFVSVTPAGDTAFWTAARAARTMERIEGEYRITSGARADQRGRWSATLERGSPLRAGGPDLGISRKPVGRVAWLALWLGVLGIAFAMRWALQPVSHHPVNVGSLSFADTRLHGVSGWMAWFLLGQAASIISSIILFSTILTPFSDGTWAMGTVIPSVQPMIAMETLIQVAQFAGPAFGLYLTLHHDPRAPRYWFVYLGALLIYSVVEFFGWSSFQLELTRAFGPAAAEEASREIATETARTARFIVWAPIWASYWTVSKRVRFTFGRGALGAPPPDSTVSGVPQWG